MKKLRQERDPHFRGGTSLCVPVMTCDADPAWSPSAAKSKWACARQGSRAQRALSQQPLRARCRRGRRRAGSGRVWALTRVRQTSAPGAAAKRRASGRQLQDVMNPLHLMRRTPTASHLMPQAGSRQSASYQRPRLQAGAVRTVQGPDRTPAGQRRDRRRRGTASAPSGPCTRTSARRL